MVKVLKIKKSKVAPVIATAVHNLYNQSAPLLMAEALLFLAVGVLILTRPIQMLTMLTFIVGGGLVLFGMYRIIAGFVISRNVGGGWFDVLFGLGNMVLGVLFCIYPDITMQGTIYIFAILFLFKALGALIFAINIARARFGHYVFNIIMSLVLVGLALLLLFFPVAGVIVLGYFLSGVLLIYAGADVYMFVELVRLKRYINDD